MIKVRKYLAFALCVGSVIACAKNEIASGPELRDSVLETKVLKLSDDFDDSGLLVKFTAVPDETFLAGLCGDGVVAVEKVFNSVPGKEELEARFGLDRWYEIILSEGARIDELAEKMASKGEVSLIEYKSIAQKSADSIVYPAYDVETKGVAGSVFNDPMLTDQWNYINNGNASISPNSVKGADVNVKDVWANLCAGDPSIVVAVVDEGVKYTHPDLAANIWTNEKEIPGNGIDDDGNGYVDDVHGYNFMDKTPEISWNKSGDSGHGTHCAGTIAAVNNNGRGVCGVAGGSGNGDGCRIMSCQIFSGNDGGYTTDIAKAIKYAADNGASVISCSFGTSSQIASDDAYYRWNSMEIDAVHYFEASRNNDVLDGNIAIFAAGNESHPYAHYPGAFNDIISVSAFGPDFLPGFYTNYGPGCNISAPGGEVGHVSGSVKSAILSTIPSEVSSRQADGKYASSDYAYMQGTSMACPHVSGVVALALSYAKKQNKTFTVDQFKQMILSSVNDIDQRIGSVATKKYAWSNIDDLSLAPYYHKMGTGAIDAWRLMMKIDGVPTSTATIGKSQWINLSQYFGTASVSLTYLSVDVPQATIDALGLQKITAASDKKNPGLPEEGYAIVQFGRLYIHPTKVGSGTLSITAVGGGDHLGGGTNPPGGMPLTETISIIARDVDGGNGTGGWL